MLAGFCQHSFIFRKDGKMINIRKRNDPYAYNFVPNYIVDMCDSIVNKIEDMILVAC